MVHKMPENTVIAIVNEKGGTGKTTTSVSLSAALGALGQKVLLVDLDGQAASSRWLGVEEDDRLAEALRRGGGLEPIRDVLPNVSLAPASGKLDSVSHDLRPTQGGQLRKVLSAVEGFDFILIDCPPSLGNRLIGNALLAATHVIVPVETSILALDGLKILLTTLEDVRDGFGHEIVLGGVLACRYDGRTRLSQLVLAELRRALPGKVFNTVIRENVRMRECPASGQSILTFAGDSHAAKDYRALAQELLDEPDKWRLTLSNSDESGAGDGAFAVDDLRDQAAAKLRDIAAARRTSNASWTRGEQSDFDDDANTSPQAQDDSGESSTVAPPGPPSNQQPAAGPPSDAPAPQPSVPAWWLVDNHDLAAAPNPAKTQPAPSIPTKADAAAPANAPAPAAPSPDPTGRDAVQQLESWLDGIEGTDRLAGEVDDGIVFLNDDEAPPLPDAAQDQPKAVTPTADPTEMARAAVAAESNLVRGLEQINTAALESVAAEERSRRMDVDTPAETPSVSPETPAMTTAETPDMAPAPAWEQPQPAQDQSAEAPEPAAKTSDASGEPGNMPPAEQSAEANLDNVDMLGFSALPPKDGHRHKPEGETSEECDRKGGLDGSGEQFPALRQMLKQMSQQDKPDEQASLAEAQARRNARRPAWRRLFDRTPSEK